MNFDTYDVNTRKKWTPSQESALRAHWLNGLPIDQLSKLMGRSEKALLDRLRGLKVGFNSYDMLSLSKLGNMERRVRLAEIVRLAPDDYSAITYQKNERPTPWSGYELKTLSEYWLRGLKISEIKELCQSNARSISSIAGRLYQLKLTPDTLFVYEGDTLNAQQRIKLACGFNNVSDTKNALDEIGIVVDHEIPKLISTNKADTNQLEVDPMRSLKHSDHPAKPVDTELVIADKASAALQKLIAIDVPALMDSFKQLNEISELMVKEWATPESIRVGGLLHKTAQTILHTSGSLLKIATPIIALLPDEENSNWSSPIEDNESEIVALPEAANTTFAISASHSKDQNYTLEQQAIIECNSSELAINAFAGTGKTSTLVGYANARPRQRLLYLAFNTAIASEAQRRFPGNVTAKTSHSLAYQKFGARYKNKLGNVKARDAFELLKSKMKVPGTSIGDHYFFAQLSLDHLRKHFSSATLIEEISDHGLKATVELNEKDKVHSSEIVKAAQVIWQSMQDPNDYSIKMEHDGYLKLFMLSRPSLDSYDAILLDEAQDTNPALFSVIQSQSIGKILVGDRHQNIYGFRDSMNAMGKLKNAKHLALTTSFRFGEKIADVANSLLQIFCSEELMLVGASAKQQSGKPSLVEIYRTNAGVFSGVVQWMAEQEEKKLPIALHLVGGVEGYKFDLISDCWYLKAKQYESIKDPFIRRFVIYAALENYADAVMDFELLVRLKIVNDLGGKIPFLVQKIRQSQTPSELALIAFTTAHKSKGLEWDVVKLGNDFPELLGSNGKPLARGHIGLLSAEQPVGLDEANLLYVASTRAMCELKPNENLARFLLWCSSNKKFLKLNSSIS